MRLWLVLATLASLAVTSCAADTFETYRNARFGYAVQYPANLLAPGREADNGDGRKFRSRDGRITLTVYGSHNALGRTHAQEFERARAAWQTDRARITLSKLAPGYFALSGFIDGDIFYEKTVFRGDDFCTLIWEYPKESKTHLDAAVTRSFNSFSPANFGRDADASHKAIVPRPKPKPIVATIPTPKRPNPRSKVTKTAPRPIAQTKPVARPKPIARVRPVATSAPNGKDGDGY